VEAIEFEAMDVEEVDWLLAVKLSDILRTEASPAILEASQTVTKASSCSILPARPKFTIDHEGSVFYLADVRWAERSSMPGWMRLDTGTTGCSILPARPVL